MEANDAYLAWKWRQDFSSLLVAKGKAQTTAATYRYGAGLVHEVTVYFALILQSNIPSKMGSIPQIPFFSIQS